MSDWQINIGVMGPTDCTLVLSRPNGKSKEALIESEAWKKLSNLHYKMRHKKGFRLDSKVCRKIWDEADFS